MTQSYILSESHIRGRSSRWGTRSPSRWAGSRAPRRNRAGRSDASPRTPCRRSRGCGARHRELAGLLVGELGEDMVLEPLDVHAADLVQVPDAVVVQPLRVEGEHLDDGHRTGVEPLREDAERPRVATAQGGDEVGGRHVEARDAVLRGSVHFFTLSSSGLTALYFYCSAP